MAIHIILATPVNGIMNISEYKIIVHPKCKNTLAELSSYCWDKNLPNTPEDKNNHLMDALRYAFYDVKPHAAPTRSFYRAERRWSI